MVDGDVMVHGINDAGQELAHISLFIVRTGQKLRPSVVKVCGDNFGDIAFLVVFVEFLQAVGEKTEGGHIGC